MSESSNHKDLLPQVVDTDTDSSVPVDLSKASLAEIAKACQDGANISTSVPETAVDNMKVFLMAYAQNQLTRVIKLTDAVTRLEDAMIDDATANVNKYSPDQLIRMFNTIHGSLQTAISLIKQVSSDDSYLQVIINNKTTVTNINEMNNLTAVDLQSQESREKVRAVAAQLLKYTTKME